LSGFDGRDIASHAATDDDEVFLLYTHVSPIVSPAYHAFTYQLEWHILFAALFGPAVAKCSAKCGRTVMRVVLWSAERCEPTLVV
jgi:hypothetical protein